MSHARQDQKQGQFAEPAVADGGGQSELIGDLLQDEEQAEDGAEDGFAGRELIEVAAEHLRQRLRSKTLTVCPIPARSAAGRAAWTAPNRPFPFSAKRAPAWFTGWRVVIRPITTLGLCLG